MKSFCFSDQIRDVYRILSGNVGRPLTRLHLHTLAYQAILVTQGSAWKNNRFAAVKASLTANRHVCASQQVSNCYGTSVLVLQFFVIGGYTKSSFIDG